MKDKILLWLGIGGFILAGTIYLFGAYASFVLEQHKHSQNLNLQFGAKP